METMEDGDDRRAIEAVIDRQFASLNWTPGTSADWGTFAADFAPGASLYPARRPATPQTVASFVERMKGVATTLTSFREVALGRKIYVFGNVAVAVAGCAMTENDEQTRRGIEMMLLIKNDGVWRIVAQAWDTESQANPMPADLLVGDVPA
jgi:hypothetical protein